MNGRTKTRGQQSGLSFCGCFVKCLGLVMVAMMILLMGHVYTHHALLTASAKLHLSNKPDLEPPGQKALETKAGDRKSVV